MLRQWTLAVFGQALSAAPPPARLLPAGIFPPLLKTVNNPSQTDNGESDPEARAPARRGAAPVPPLRSLQKGSQTPDSPIKVYRRGRQRGPQPYVDQAQYRRQICTPTHSVHARPTLCSMPFRLTAGRTDGIFPVAPVKPAGIRRCGSSFPSERLSQSRAGCWPSTSPAVSPACWRTSEPYREPSFWKDCRGIDCCPEGRVAVRGCPKKSSPATLKRGPRCGGLSLIRGSRG